MTRSVRALRPWLGAALACGAMPLHALNNCSSFTDLRDQTNVNVNTVLGQHRYSPSCLRISPGTTVTFRSDFAQHPLYGGTVSQGTATIDPASPIGAHTNGTTPVVVSFPDAGEYPFFCDFHFTTGMLGSVLVDPSLFRDGFE